MKPKKIKTTLCKVSILPNRKWSESYWPYPLGFGLHVPAHQTLKGVSFSANREGQATTVYDSVSLNKKGDKFYHQYLLYRLLNEKEGFVNRTKSDIPIRKGLVKNAHCNNTKLKNLLDSKFNKSFNGSLMNISGTQQTAKGRPFKSMMDGLFTHSEFFPYRKSFTCYWLLPFVGFVYTVWNQPGSSSMTPTNAILFNNGYSSVNSRTFPLQKTNGTEELLRRDSAQISLAFGNVLDFNPVNGNSGDIENYCKWYLSSLDNYVKIREWNPTIHSGSHILLNHVNEFQNQQSLENKVGSSSNQNVFRKNGLGFLKKLSFSYSAFAVKGITPFNNNSQGFNDTVPQLNGLKMKNDSQGMNKKFHAKIDALENAYSLPFGQNASAVSPSVKLAEKRSVLSYNQNFKSGEGQNNTTIVKGYNPWYSYLQASSLLDRFNKQLLGVSTKTLGENKENRQRFVNLKKVYKVNFTNLYGKFFAYGAIMDKLNSPIVSSLFLNENESKESTLTSIDSLDTGKKAVKLSKDKLYQSLFNALDKYTLLIGVNGSENKQMESIVAPSAEQQNVYDKGYENNEIYKYSHPVLMSTNLNKNKVNPSTSQSEKSLFVKKSLETQTQLANKNFDLSELQLGSLNKYNSNEKNLNKDMDPLIEKRNAWNSQKSYNTEFYHYSNVLKMYGSKVKEFLIQARLNKESFNTPYRLDEKQRDSDVKGSLAYTPEKTNEFLINSLMDSSLKNNGSEKNLKTSRNSTKLNFSSKIEKLLRAYFSIKNSYTNAESGSSKKSESGMKSGKVNRMNNENTMMVRSKMPELRNKMTSLQEKLTKKLLKRMTAPESFSFSGLNQKKEKPVLLKIKLSGAAKAPYNISGVDDRFALSDRTHQKTLTLVKTFLLHKNSFRTLGYQNLIQRADSGLGSSLDGDKVLLSSSPTELRNIQSPSLLVKNRLLLLSNQRLLSPQAPLAQKELSSNDDLVKGNNEVTALRKGYQKKRRIKKLKKETRQRKKRKRFYPRPFWIRYRLYSQLLKNRYYKTNHKMNPSEVTTTSDTRWKYPVGDAAFAATQSTYTRTFAKPQWLPQDNTNTKNEFYTISRPVLGELKRVLWKSYWLRKNLNPYLNGVKTYLKNIKQSKQSWEVYTNVQSFMNYVFGFTQQGMTSNSVLWAGDTISQNKRPSMLVGGSSFTSTGLNTNLPLYMTTNPLSNTVFLAEYNRNSYERIQQFISQIRENLTLNGGVKVRASHVGYSPFKDKRGLTTKKNEDFWVKLGKALTFETSQSSIAQSTSKLRLYWAFSKTSYGFFKENNPRKERWATTKKRESTKNNKTKKIFRNVSTQFETLLNQRFPFLPDSLEGKLFVLPDVDGQGLKSVQVNTGENSMSSSSTKDGISKLLGKALRKARQKEEKASVFYNQSAFLPKTSLSGTAGTNVSVEGVKQHTLLSLNLVSGKNESAFTIRETGKKKYIIEKITRNGVKQTLSSSGTNTSDMDDFSHGEPLVQNTTYRRDNIKNHLSNKSAYWWTETSPGISALAANAASDTVSFLKNFKTNVAVENSSNTNILISSVLFHFCTVLSILSIPQIRSFLKFVLLGLSKIYKTAISILLNFSFDKMKSVSSMAKKSAGTSKTSFNKLSVWNNLGMASGAQKVPVGQADLNTKTVMNLFSSALSNDVSTKNGKKALGANNQGKYIKRLTGNSEDGRTGQLAGKNENRNVSVLKTLLSKKQKGSLSSENVLYNSAVMTKNFFSQSGNTTSRLNSKTSHYKLQNFYFFRILTYMYDSLNRSPKTQTDKNSDSSLFLTGESNFNTKMYLFIRYCIKKPIYIYKMTFQKTSGETQRNGSKATALSNAPKNSSVSSKVPNVQNALIKQKDSSILVSTLSKTTLYSLLAMNIICENMFNVYNSSAAVVKEVKVNFFEKFLRSIYTFLEKPGEQIVDWVAYMFLVEWASDITNTIPENLDIYLGSTTSKLTRTLFFESLQFNQYLLNQFLYESFIQKQSFTKPSSNLFSEMGLLHLASPFIKNRIYHMYEILLLQFYQPDTDLILRQKKGILFWDIWGDFLMQTAEDSNINISELTSVKEEQIKLLEKCETSPMSVINPMNSTDNSSMKLTKKKFVKYSQMFSCSLKEPQTSNEEKQTKSTNLFGAKNQKQSFFNLLNVPFAVGDSVKNTEKNFSFVHLKTGDLGDIRAGWGAQQFLSYQGKDTELFIDLHPRGGLSDIVSLVKWNESVQQPIGTLVCQIYSGLLSKQISKNILIVGSSGMEKTLLVQAIAGETELKIITDNAYRYAMVYRGVAVGIKLLRDVFDSLVATGPPCLFLIEDIHAIGERRPLLISDDENLSKKDGTSQEIHEKNQVFYQLSKHVITHYKKPYKGDFSLLIPTNHFCFDLFLVRLNANTQGLSANKPTSSRSRKHAVLPKISVAEGKKDNGSESTMNDSNNMSSSISSGKTSATTSYKNLPSRLLIKSSELLAPPASSPFSFLTLKEEKKFKPLKTVGEMPWGWGGPHREQLAQVSKASYSIRVKVALLADMAISSLSVKLDMITDLLVIIDSVKGNRGFVIFATTHVPYVLDPALRRPGRLDETISLGLVPTLFSRWEILKSSFSALNPGLSANEPSGLFTGPTYKNTLDFSYFNKNISNQYSISQIQTKIFNFISNKKTSEMQFLQTKGISKSFNSSPMSIASVFENSTNSNLSNSLQNIKKFVEYKAMKDVTSLNRHSIVHKTSRKILSQTYFSASVMLIQHQSSNQMLTASTPSVVGTFSEKDSWGEGKKANSTKQFFLSELTPSFFNDNSRIINLYASPQQLKNHLIYLMSGKLGEMFLFSKTSQLKDLTSIRNKIVQNKELCMTHNNTNMRNNYSSVYSSFGLSNTWQSLTSLVLSYIHKRYIYHKNLIVPKLLNFTNYSSLLEYPSPPATNILLPAKRYENYKRSFAFFALKRQTSISIREKINLHQQQRLVKRLYRYPVQELFRSELLENRFTTFTNAGLMIGSMEPILQKPSSSNWFVKNRIFMRHRNSLTNQWWNGQLPEHNAETTFLSDIDWRYTFISQPGDGSETGKTTDVKDILLDFPDTDQHYNPRNRRWLLTKGSYNNWFDFDKTILSEIYSHFIFDSFVKAYHVFEKNRDVLDFYAFYLLKSPTAQKRTETILKLYLKFFNSNK